MRTRREACKLRCLAFLSVLAASVGPLAPADAVATTCFGRTPTIVGSAGDDYLVADPGVVNVIYGAGGNDTIWGAYGASLPGDYLCGGPGHDSISGGTGDDHVSGGDDSDRVDGGGEDSGDDMVNGDAGDDYVSGTNDCEFPDDTGTDVLNGGSGNDYICSDAGRDVLHGQAGNDALDDFSRESSHLYGGPGSDTLSSWSYPRRPRSHFLPDYLSGGDGFDRATASRNDKLRTTERVTYCCTVVGRR